MLVDLQADPLKTQIFFDHFSLFFIHFCIKGADSSSSWCKNLWFVGIKTVVGKVSFLLAIVASGIVHVSGIFAVLGTVYIHDIEFS